MKIGIVIHSITGKSITSLKRMVTKLTSKGHSVDLEGINPPEGWTFGNPLSKLDKNPDIDKYDVVILVAPVMAFSLSPVMSAYLNNMENMSDKKVFLLVTKALPFYWTGGYQAVGLFEKLCKAKNAKVIGTQIININKLYTESVLDGIINKVI